MKNLILIPIFFILLIGISNSLSQDDISHAKTQNDTFINSYDKGIQFYLVNGVSFAIKTRKPYPSTWRLLFDLSGRLTDESSNSKTTYTNNPDQEYEYENERSEFNFAFSIQYNYFLNINRYFDPYFGIGPLFNYDRYSSDDSQKEIISYNTNRSDNSTNTNYGFGVIAVAGLESEAWKHLSLFLEYNINFRYYWENYDYEIYDSVNDVRRTSRRTGTGTQLELSRVKIGVIIYF